MIYFQGPFTLAHTDCDCMDGWPVSLACEWSMTGIREQVEDTRVALLVAIGGDRGGLVAVPFASGFGRRRSSGRIADAEVARLDAEAAHSWDAYLKAGPSVWSSLVHPSVTPEVRSSIWQALRKRRMPNQAPGWNSCSGSRASTLRGSLAITPTLRRCSTGFPQRLWDLSRFRHPRSSRRRRRLRWWSRSR